MVAESNYLFALSKIVHSNGLAKRPKNKLLVWSFDGYWDQYLKYAGRDPVWSRLEREGCRAGLITPVFPTRTFCIHTSIVTGTRANVNMPSFHIFALLVKFWYWVPWQACRLLPRVPIFIFWLFSGWESCTVDFS